MSAQDYYRDGDRPHERHHDGPPHREESRGGSDYYNHDGGRDRSRSKSRERRGSDGHKDRDIAGTLIGGAAGAFGGHALGAKAGHGVIGTVLGGVAGAFAGHEVEEKVDDWKDERKEKKEDERRHKEDDERHRRDDEDRRRRDDEDRRRREDDDRRRREDDDRRRDDYHHHDQPRGGPETVVVQQGDTLRGIAARFPGVSFEEIARHNNIANPDMIYPGQTLAIPHRGGC
ncbi:hypothetical protein N8I77_009985 [Diaporthe amygdali]|uniref:LysM domain-containing protein n=1 Tax=Phomopsis amygdali TaxID=1214568 RepID=A0AAD9S6Z5_PHOAM|nr:carbohydrate-binding module family 50 protein [Diaporthe amygdali]KAJ0122895.1 carbohydrate-binding module family 50 protein [Diaporthe amygdali]KAK2600457.1 hypothetical protein N8I77_009985 [Diaporthe amygdali]